MDSQSAGNQALRSSKRFIEPTVWLTNLPVTQAAWEGAQRGLDLVGILQGRLDS